VASKAQIERLAKAIEAIRSVDKDRLLRTSLGEASLKEELGPKLEELNGTLDFATEYAPDVFESHVIGLNDVLEQIHANMHSQASTADAEYVAQRNSFLVQFEAHRNEIKQHWPPFIAAAVEARGFLKDAGVKQEYENALASMKEEADKSIKNVQEETTKAIEEAKVLAKDIEKTARRTAAKISVEEAQTQFAAAEKDHEKHVRIWAWISGLAIAAFIGVVVYFIRVGPPQELTYQVIYFTATRLALLGVIGAGATFSLRILRAHMHMKQHNMHRQRLANSIAAFVESAATPEQRDLILTHLVEAISTFKSGLLHKEGDSMSLPKMVIEQVSRTITSSE